MPASDLLLPFTYLVLVITLSQFPPRILEQASEKATAATGTTKSNENTASSQGDPKSIPSPLLAAKMEKSHERRQPANVLDASNLDSASSLPFTRRSHSSFSSSSHQKQIGDVSHPQGLIYDVYVSNLALLNALILQIAQLVLAYFFAKSMFPYMSPSRPWRDRFCAGALPGIAITNALTSMGACQRLYQAWTGNLEVLKWRRDPGALAFAGLGTAFTSPFVLLWPIIWICRRFQ